MADVSACPKCGFPFERRVAECPKCGVILQKYLRRQTELETRKQVAAALSDSLNLKKIASARSLVIRQRVEWGEVVTGFETRNRYAIRDENNRHLFDASEESGALGRALLRHFLRRLRPFTIAIHSPLEGAVMSIRRPFRFFFHEVGIYSEDDALLGRVTRRFSILRRIYAVSDHGGEELFTLFGPILHPWTFRIMRGGAVVGKITKKWSGLFKETFSDADNFGVVLPEGIDLRQKAILLGAVFLIDFVHFEK